MVRHRYTRRTCPGPALVARFNKALPELSPWRRDENCWVRRMVGVAVHFWAKRSAARLSYPSRLKNYYPCLSQCSRNATRMWLKAWAGVEDAWEVLSRSGCQLVKKASRASAPRFNAAQGDDLPAGEISYNNRKMIPACRTVGGACTIFVSYTRFHPIAGIGMFAAG